MKTSIPPVTASPLAPALSLGLLMLTGLAPGCDDSPTGRAPDEGDRASTEFCVEAGTPAAEGVLALVNDAAIDAALLDASVASGGAGLYRTAAYNIVDARPIETVEQLDAVPYVGSSACRALARYACNEQGRCQAPLSLVSWNIEHFPLAEETTTDAVEELIEDLRPDVIGVQEIQDREAFWDLMEALPDYEGIIGARGYFTRVGIIYRTDAVELLETEDLFVDDRYNFPRSVLSARLDVVGALEPTTIDFAVVHLKAFGDSQSESRRRAAVTQLRTWVDDRREEGEGEVVIVGDWNDRLTDQEQDNVFTALTEDEASGEFLTLEAAEADESSYVPFSSLIDHIYATDEALEALEHQQTSVLYLDETWDPDYETLVSDHRPVRSEFTVAQGYDE